MAEAAPSDLDLAARVDASVGDGDLGGRRLRFGAVVALSVGIQGPTAGVLVGPAVLAGIVGGAGALAYLLGLVAMAFVAYAFVVFARSFNSAGSVYAFNAAALGPSYGFVSAWLLLAVYVSFAGAVSASTGDLAQTLAASFGIHRWWVWFALAAALLTMVAAYLSIRVSSIVVLVCEGGAIAVLAVVAVLVVTGADGGTFAHGGLSLAPFRPHGIALGVLGLGVVNAFGAFSGFEGAACLGEEARRSTRTIPAAVAGSLVLSGLAYVLLTWVADSAFRSPAALAADPAPFVHLASARLGPAMGKLVNAAGLVSAFGAQLACINAANRLTFSLARDVVPTGRVRTGLLHVDRRRSAPTGALVLTGAASTAALLAFAWEPTATRALTIIVELGAYLIIAAYLLTVVAALAWVWRHRRRPVPLILLGAGVIALGYVLYDTFVPLPAPPFDRVALTAAGYAVAGVMISVLPPMRRRLGRSPLLCAVRSGPAGHAGPHAR
jgi:amino acid transporter